MERFLDRHKDRIAGSISGFDRMRFTGTLRWMAHVDGMGKFLNSQGLLLKHFGAYIETVSEQIKQYGYGIAEAKGRPVQYVASSSESKEDIAIKIAQRDPTVVRCFSSTEVGGMAGEIGRRHPSVSARQIGFALQAVLLEFGSKRICH